MKKFDNAKFKDPEKNLDAQDNPIKNYSEVLIIAINTPTDPNGFSPKENFERMNLIKTLDSQKDSKKIELKPADFEKVKKAFNNLKSTASDEMAEMYEYLESI